MEQTTKRVSESSVRLSREALEGVTVLTTFAEQPAIFGLTFSTATDTEAEGDLDIRTAMRRLADELHRVATTIEVEA